MDAYNGVLFCLTGWGKLPIFSHRKIEQTFHLFGYWLQGELNGRYKKI